MRWSFPTCGALLLAATLVPAAPAAASERMLEDLALPDRFAPVWPGGVLGQGADEDLHWLSLTLAGTPQQPEVAYVANAAPYTPALDLRGRFIKVWIKVDDLEQVGGMEFRLASGNPNRDYYAFSFTRYADLDSNLVREGVWNVLTLPFAGARVVGHPRRSAITHIGWFASNRGTGVLHARWGGLAAVDEPREGVLSFTFDDGYDEHYQAAELLAKYGFRATAYVIPSLVGQPGYMTLAQLGELDKRFGWEVAAHHETSLTEFGADELEGRLLGIQRYLAEHGFGRGAQHLAYPLGRQDPSRVRPAVRAHFSSARVAGGGMETLPPGDRHLLRVENVTRSTTPAQLADAARSARADRHWLILMFHYLVPQPQQDTEYRLADFEALLPLIQQTGVRVLPLIEVFDACGGLGEGNCRFQSVLAAPAPP